jgi:hypothetical protein
VGAYTARFCEAADRPAAPYIAGRFAALKLNGELLLQSVPLPVGLAARAARLLKWQRIHSQRGSTRDDLQGWRGIIGFSFLSGAGFVRPIGFGTLRSPSVGGVQQQYVHLRLFLPHICIYNHLLVSVYYLIIWII